MRQISRRTWLLIVISTITAFLVLLVDLLKGALVPSLLVNALECERVLPSNASICPEC